jgi:hypothetical protein
VNPELLIEAAAGAHRERDVYGRPIASPAWWDLAPVDRERLFELQSAMRDLERAMDSRGLSSTVRAVLARIR